MSRVKASIARAWQRGGTVLRATSRYVQRSSVGNSRRSSLQSVINVADRRRAPLGKARTLDDRRRALARLGMQAFLVERLDFSVTEQRSAVHPGLRDRRRARRINHGLQ